MSTNVETGVETQLGKSWRYLAVVGGMISVLGLLAIAFPFVTGLSLSMLLGVLLIIGAIGHVAHAFSARGWKGFLAQTVLAAIYAVGGIALLVNPALGLATLTLVLAGFLLADGVVEMGMGLRLRPESGWGWLVASGVLALLVGVLVWMGWPSTAAWALGVLFGVNLLSTGLSMVMLAMGGRKATRDVTSPGGSARGA